MDLLHSGKWHESLKAEPPDLKKNVIQSGDVALHEVGVRRQEPVGAGQVERQGKGRACEPPPRCRTSAGCRLRSRPFAFLATLAEGEIASCLALKVVPPHLPRLQKLDGGGVGLGVEVAAEE